MKDNLIWTQENIRYQGTDLYEKITAQVKLIIEKNKIPADGKSTKFPLISDAIKKHTGLNIVVSTERMFPAYNAYVYTPLIHLKNNNNFVGMYFQEDAKLNKKIDGLKSTVDIKKGMVTGYFSELKSDVHISSAIIFSGEFTPDEVAAIILHEVGHVFTMCFYINHVIRGAYLSSFASKEILGAKTDNERRVALTTLNTVTKDKRLKDLLDSGQLEDSDKLVTQVVLDHSIQEIRSETGTVNYDYRVVEQVADHFAAMHGASYALVTGLIKIHKLSGDNVSQNFTQYYLGQIALCVGALGLVAVGAAIGNPVIPIWIGTVLVISTLVSITTNEQYDGFERRIEVLRRDTIEALKDRTLDKSDKDELLDKIKSIEFYQSQLKQYPSIFSLAVYTISKKKRDLAKEIKSQSLIEELINNDLFVKSAKF